MMKNMTFLFHENIMIKNHFVLPSDTSLSSFNINYKKSLLLLFGQFYAVVNSQYCYSSFCCKFQTFYF